MNVIVILISFSLLVAGFFLAGFIWAVKSGQYDDRYTPSVRILFDDSPSIEGNKEVNQNEKV
jgi:cbb3-type cytochrome oxidase maturation protein